MLYTTHMLQERGTMCHETSIEDTSQQLWLDQGSSYRTRQTNLHDSVIHVRSDEMTIFHEVEGTRTGGRKTVGELWRVRQQSSILPIRYVRFHDQHITRKHKETYTVSFG